MTNHNIIVMKLTLENTTNKSIGKAYWRGNTGSLFSKHLFYNFTTPLSVPLFRNIKSPLGNTSLHVSIWLTRIKTSMSFSQIHPMLMNANTDLNSHCWHWRINRQCSGKGQILTCDLAVSGGLSHLIVALKQGVDWHSEAEKGPYVSRPSVCHRVLSDMQGQTH